MEGEGEKALVHSASKMVLEDQGEKPSLVNSASDTGNKQHSASASGKKAFNYLPCDYRVLEYIEMRALAKGPPRRRPPPEVKDLGIVDGKLVTRPTMYANQPVLPPSNLPLVPGLFYPEGAPCYAPPKGTK